MKIRIINEGDGYFHAEGWTDKYGKEDWNRIDNTLATSIRRCKRKIKKELGRLNFVVAEFEVFK